MAISGNFPPSKVLVLARTGQPTLTIQASTVWYIHEDPDDPASMVVRYQDPLSPGSSNIVFGSFTGSADGIAASLGMFVKVTPVTNTSTFSNIYPTVPFWFNVCMFKDLNDRTSYRILRLGTANATESLSISNTYASITAAINVAANPPSSNNVLSVAPAGTDQATATRVPIVRGAGDYTVFVGGISSSATDGIRIEMVAEDGTTVIPIVIGTKVTVHSSAILTNDILVYPQVGANIEGLGAGIGWPLNIRSTVVFLASPGNTWQIQSDEFVRVETAEIVQGDNTLPLNMGSAAGVGVVARGTGLSPTHLGLTDPNYGFKFVSNTVEVINTGATAAVFYGNGLVRIGGDVTGSPGGIVSTPDTVIPTTAGVGVGSPLTMVVETITGASAFVQHNGDPGSETTYWNLHPTDSFEFKDQLGTTIGLPIPAQSYVTFRSYNQGANWSQGTILPI